MPRTAVALLLNFLAAGSLAAATITVQHAYEFPAEDTSNKTWALPKFDASLGTLTSVEYYAGGAMWADYSVVGTYGAGGFSVGVGGFFSLSGPGLTARVNVPVKSTGSQFVAKGGTVSGRIESSGDASGVLYTPAAFLPGSSNLNLTIGMYQPQNYGYGTTLIPDICWHGSVGFVVVYNFESVTGGEVPEPATWLTMFAGIPTIWLVRRARRSGPTP